jgi:hypothetical protein
MELTRVSFPYSDPHRVNIIAGEAEERSMTTGVHVVQNISCCQCKVVLGWAYVSYDHLQRYE